MNQQPVLIEFEDYLIQISIETGESIGQRILTVRLLKDDVEIDKNQIEVTGTAYLYTASDSTSGATVLLDIKTLYISCGTSLYSISIPDLRLNWEFQPEQFDLFELYELENGLLIRGELLIYRIDKAGKLIWQFGGKDIFVNIDGKPEVQIFDDYIILTDFNAEQYKISYSGKIKKINSREQQNKASAPSGDSKGGVEHLS